MSLGISLSFVAAALLLTSAGSAYADTTYDIATTTSLAGTVSGSITGTGTTLTGFEITATDGASTYIFDSSVAGETGSFSAQTGFTLSPGGPTLNLIDLLGGGNSHFDLLVSGDFTTGLTPVERGEVVYYNGIGDNVADGAIVTDSFGNPAVQDDVSLTAQSTVVPTPEPSSLLLMGTGLAGVCATLRRHLRT